MLFDKNDDLRNERILYQTKPNMLFGCKKAIFGVVLLIIALMLSSMAIKFIGEMQVYLISHIELSLTRYTAIAFFVVILIIIVYIIWQLIGWYSKEYTLTQSRVIIKSGVLSTKKNYMPYASIQDINTSQSIVARMFNVGSISIFSAYDNNQMELSAISNPSEIEDIIFSNMVNRRSYNEPRSYLNEDRSYERNFQTDDSYIERDEYYDEFEPITPIGREKDNPPRREYEYYPNDFGYEETSRKKYEYEPYNDEYITVEKNPLRADLRREEPSRGYDDSFYGAEDRPLRADLRREEPSRGYDDSFYGAERKSFESDRYEEPSRPYDDGSYYDEVRNDYSYDDNYYHDNDSGMHYNDDGKNAQHNSENADNSSEKVIRRHFDKFKK